MIVILVSLEIKIEANTVAGTTRLSAPASSSKCQAKSPGEWRSYWTYSSFAAKVRPINFPYFSQKDPRYSESAYGYSDTKATKPTTIGRGGCGVTAAAMVLRYYGICTDPVLVSKYSLNNGFRYNGVGTSGSMFRSLAKAKGLRYAGIGYNDKSTKEEKWDFVYYWALRGYPIIASVNNHTFTNDSHYIVIIGMDRNGNLIIADPNSERDTRRATFNEIKSWLNHAHVMYK